MVGGTISAALRASHADLDVQHAARALFAGGMILLSQNQQLIERYADPVSSELGFG